MISRVFTGVLLALAILQATPAAAQAPAAEAPVAVSAASDAAEAEAQALFEEWDRTSVRAEETLAAAAASTPALEVLRQSLVDIRTEARGLADRARQALAPVQAQLDALGPPPEDPATEPEPVRRQREELAAVASRLDARARTAERDRARAAALVTDLDTLIRARLVDTLTDRGRSPLDPALWPAAVEEVVDILDRIGAESTTAMGDQVRRQQRSSQLPFIALAVLAALGVGIWARQAMVALIARRAAAAEPGRRMVGLAGLTALARLALPAIAMEMVLVAVWRSDILGAAGLTLLWNAAIGVALLIGAQAVSLAYYAPDHAALRLSRLDDRRAARAARLGVALGVVLLVQVALLATAEELGASPETLGVLNLPVMVAGGLVLWPLLRLVHPRQSKAEERASAIDEATDDSPGLLRRLQGLAFVAARAVAIGAPALAAAGYYAGSSQIFFNTAVTLGVLGVSTFLYVLVRDWVEDYVDTGDEGAEDHAADTPRAGSGLRLIPVMAGALILFVAAPVLALVWGARPADLADVWTVLVEGGTIGETRIAPGDFIAFGLVFGLIYTLSRMLQGLLARSVLPNTRLDTGAQTALLSFVGYAGFAVASLSAVSAAGLDLSSLAIVAGALSVGIGFGLQNIVNNFVSGVILLVERPIKVGDWIEVGGVHGTVRKISVRATEIDTFDRSALIVPNGDLISGTLTNYTHGNQMGRLIVPVGVAYGSDVRRVETILREIAMAHPMVMKRPPPMILFMAFGESSLDFELRVILSDVGYIMGVRSQFHFDIERRLREEGIEIPFPQRDLNLRDPGALAGAFAAATAPRRHVAQDDAVAAPSGPPPGPRPAITGDA